MLIQEQRGAGCIFSWLLPYAASSIFTGLAACLLTGFGTFTAVSLEWLVENISYYLLLWQCQKNSSERLFNTPASSISALLIIESLDSLVRLSLFWLANQIPSQQRPAATLLASLLADVSFVLTLSKSRRLLELCRRSCKKFLELVGCWRAPSRAQLIRLEL